MLNLTGGADYSQAHKADLIALKHSLRFLQYERVPIHDYSGENYAFSDAVACHIESVDVPQAVMLLANYLTLNYCALSRFLGSNDNPMERDHIEKLTLGGINKPDDRLVDAICAYLSPERLQSCMGRKVCRTKPKQRVLF